MFFFCVLLLVGVSVLIFLLFVLVQIEGIMESVVLDEIVLDVIVLMQGYVVLIMQIVIKIEVMVLEIQQFVLVVMIQQIWDQGVVLVGQVLCYSVGVVVEFYGVIFGFDELNICGFGLNNL